MCKKTGIAVFVVALLMTGCRSTGGGRHDEAQNTVTISTTATVAANQAATSLNVSSDLTVDAFFFEFEDKCDLTYPESGFTPGSEIIQETKCARSQLRWPVGMVATDAEIEQLITQLVPDDPTLWLQGTFEAGWGLMEMIAADACGWNHVWMNGYEQHNQVMMDAALQWFTTDYPGYVDQFREYDLVGHQYDITQEVVIRYIKGNDYLGVQSVGDCAAPGSV